MILFIIKTSSEHVNDDAILWKTLLKSVNLDNYEKRYICYKAGHRSQSITLSSSGYFNSYLYVHLNCFMIIAIINKTPVTAHLLQ